MEVFTANLTAFSQPFQNTDFANLRDQRDQREKSPENCKTIYLQETWNSVSSSPWARDLVISTRT
jgi:hypothetical protein